MKFDNCEESVRLKNGISLSSKKMAQSLKNTEGTNTSIPVSRITVDRNAQVVEQFKEQNAPDGATDSSAVRTVLLCGTLLVGAGALLYNTVTKPSQQEDNGGEK